MRRLLLAVFLCLGCMICYAGGMQESISKNVTRLHIVANSNSDEDQAIKLLVRDNVLKDLKFDKENIQRYISETQNNVNKYLEENNINYRATVEYKETYFPTKHYSNISLPAGNYMAVNVKLGEAKGENWWCVMFPPLCFTESATGRISQDGEGYLKETLAKEEFKLITLNDDMQFKFKIIEIFR